MLIALILCHICHCHFINKCIYSQSNTFSFSFSTFFAVSFCKLIHFDTILFWLVNLMIFTLYDALFNCFRCFFLYNYINIHCFNWVINYFYANFVFFSNSGFFQYLIGCSWNFSDYSFHNVLRKGINISENSTTSRVGQVGNVARYETFW